MTDHLPFTSIGKYRLESLVGQGAMGVVYRGFDPDIERPVAIKMLHEHLVSGREEDHLLTRFRQEAQAAARCLHTNIVTLFDYGVLEHSPYMVMEYVDGIDLRSFLRERVGLSFRQIVDLVVQVLDALDYAHRQGVVHRDIKPANILLLDSGQVKVTDFGVAKLDTSDLTHVGDIIGTPSYMSPEALRGELVDGRSDLYSAGIVLLELLSGERPRKQGVVWEPAEIEAAVVASHRLPPRLVEDFSELITRALAEDPADRFESGQTFAVRLKSLTSPNQVYVPELDDLAATVVQSKRSVARRPRPDKGTGTTGAQVTLSPEMSQILSQHLAPFLGPMASHMVRLAASQSINMRDMIDRLSRRIPSEKERRDFLGSLNRTGIQSLQMNAAMADTFGPGDSHSTGALDLPQEVVTQVTELLAYHVGPLASRLVGRSLRSVQSEDELCEALARFIPGEMERSQFLLKARSRFRQGS